MGLRAVQPVLVDSVQGLAEPAVAPPVVPVAAVAQVVPAVELAEAEVAADNPASTHQCMCCGSSSSARIIST